MVRVRVRVSYSDRRIEIRRIEKEPVTALSVLSIRNLFVIAVLSNIDLL